MKLTRIFQQYIWIVNTLRQYKKLSFVQLNELWMKDEVIGGEPLNRKSFLRHKDAILNLFGIGSMDTSTLSSILRGVQIKMCNVANEPRYVQKELENRNQRATDGKVSRCEIGR